MDEQQLQHRLAEIIERHARDDRVLVSESFADGGLEMLFARLHRAGLNQLGGPGVPAAVTRYGIWATTARDHLRDALSCLEDGEVDEARRRLVLVANALSAFAEIQALVGAESGLREEPPSGPEGG